MNESRVFSFDRKFDSILFLLESVLAVRGVVRVRSSRCSEISDKQERPERHHGALVRAGGSLSQDIQSSRGKEHMAKCYHVLLGSSAAAIHWKEALAAAP